MFSDHPAHQNQELNALQDTCAVSDVVAIPAVLDMSDPSSGLDLGWSDVLTGFWIPHSTEIGI